MTSTPDHSERCRLPDGRTLSFAYWGAPDGVPLLYFHGTPGSRFNALSFHTPAREAGVRVIAPERPGFGFSTRSAPRRLRDWADDVAAFADHLRLERFHLLGMSGGGPHALVCAALIPERLKSVTVSCSLAPLDVPDATKGMDPGLRRMWQASPRVQRWLVRALGIGSRFAPDAALIPTRDPHAVRFFEDPEIREGFLRDMREALRDGGTAMADEMAMLSKPWGFELGDIRLPVRIWHGEIDANCPISMGEHLIREIPNAEGTIFPGEGHLCAGERLDELFAPIKA